MKNWRWSLIWPAAIGLGLVAAVLARDPYVETSLGILSHPWSMAEGPDRRHKSDAEMATNFRAHEADFERLVAMFQADTATRQVRPLSLVLLEMPPVPVARYLEYRRLFARTGVYALDRWGDQICLRCTTVRTYDRKGYLWSPTTPRPIVEDETTNADFGEGVAYKPLKPRWFIYYQSHS